MAGLNVNQMMQGVHHNGAQNPPQVQPPPQQGAAGGAGVQNAGQAQGGAPQTPNIHLNRLKKVGVGSLLALRALGAVGTLGLSEGIVRGVRTLARGVGMQRTTGMQVNVTLPQAAGVQPQGGQVNMSAHLPKRIPNGMTQNQLEQLIQAKVNNGHALLSQVRQGNAPVQCTLTDMSDIMHFLQAMAGAKGQDFSQGAFSIDDSGGAIRAFLDTCPQAYQRNSSHVGSYQSAGGGRHRGIDVHGRSANLQTTLPGHKKTLLYGSLQSNVGHNLPADRLFLKMESHGAYLTSPKGGGDGGRPKRYANYHDASAMLGHTFSYFATRGQGSALGSRKERIPDTVKTDYKNLINSAPSQNIKNLLEANGPLSTSGGIKTMLANLNQVPGNTGNAVFDQDVLNFIASLQAYDHPGERIGNEVILDRVEMGI